MYMTKKALFELRSLQESDYTSEALYLVWRLRSTVLTSLLPFGHPEINLDTKAKVVAAALNGFPSTRALGSEIEAHVKKMVTYPDSPKADIVRSFLRDRQGKIGFVTNTVRGRGSGFDQSVRHDLSRINRGLQFIESEADLYSNDYDNIVLCSGGRNCPLSNSLWLGYHCSQLDLMLYRGEGRLVVSRPRLPQGTRVLISLVSAGGAGEDADEESVGETRFDDAYWQYLRRSARDASVYQSHSEGADLSVSARLVLLSQEQKVWLAADRKVLAGSSKSLDEDSFRYVPLSQLKEGDYIALRTSGDGDIVREVADTLLASTGQADLRRRALDWKPALLLAIEKHGVDALARDMQHQNVEIRNPEYIRIWTTDIVMRPQKLEKFSILMRTVQKRGGGLNPQHIDEYVSSRWQMMDEIDSYHMKAGFKIRRELLQVLKERFRNEPIGDFLRLQIPTLGNASMSIFRVYGVDSQTETVPFRQTGFAMVSREPELWPV